MWFFTLPVSRVSFRLGSWPAVGEGGDTLTGVETHPFIGVHSDPVVVETVGGREGLLLCRETIRGVWVHCCVI